MERQSALESQLAGERPRVSRLDGDPAAGWELDEATLRVESLELRLLEMPRNAIWRRRSSKAIRQVNCKSPRAKVRCR